MASGRNFPPLLTEAFAFSRQRQRELGLTRPGTDPAAFQRATGWMEGFMTAARLLGLETGGELMPAASATQARVHLPGE